MSSEDGEVYIMRETDEDEWLSPRPARAAIVDAVASATDLDRDDLDDVDAYLDLAALERAIEASEPFQFSVEGHGVTVDPDGEISVDA